MQDTGLLAVGILMNLVAVLFVITAAVLILIILVQRGKGGGLSGAFGGGMGGGLMGSKTGDFLTWVTIALVAIFLVLAVLMAKFYRPTVGEYSQQQPAEQSAPAGEIPQQANQPEEATGQAPQQSQQQIPTEETISPSESENIEDFNVPTD